MRVNNQLCEDGGGRPVFPVQHTTWKPAENGQTALFLSAGGRGNFGEVNTYIHTHTHTNTHSLSPKIAYKQIFSMKGGHTKKLGSDK